MCRTSPLSMPWDTVPVPLVLIFELLCLLRRRQVGGNSLGTGHVLVSDQ